MRKLFEPIAHSWIARHPEPLGVIEFIGGALFGTLPWLNYDAFLQSIYDAGYTVIAVPFRFGFDHEAIAKILLDERTSIRALLDYPADLPHIWVGHSLGCKYIILLEAHGQIYNQPSLLIAPDIADTRNAVPVPIPGLVEFLDAHGLGAIPTRAQTQQLVRESALFNLTGLISFASDDIAGNQAGLPPESDVGWFVSTLADRRLLKAELPGRHNDIIGVSMGEDVFDLDPHDGLVQRGPRALELLAVELLEKLRGKAEKLV
ncbi:DUF1350 family protein [Gloeobacter kilaueensis]|uniref:DUF1350 domain-containing protein n=1 Tax=Gloeobacter kilaueensis (strain ATCC BAA-2537 / CCAP 1431/1 / ULC 316 / JS1) TaxID=1183438 RepID=U5QHG4_GLOK1|nr:DUF1350 family protein [Gloeobacter kilaueensis]AGY57079.1 hypothetical protein GKIL_0833 [Gloeobacter kilaueensis JS1]